jgi:hypothetical protein
MKLLINPYQLSLLTTNFYIKEGKGLCEDTNHLINESRMKEFLVKVWFQGWPSEIRVGANSSASALTIAKLMFPKANVTASVTSL